MIAQPPNDNRDDAVQVDELPFRDSVNAQDATLEAGEPTELCVPFANTLWYEVTLRSATQVLVDTAGSTFDTAAAVWSSDLQELISCNDDTPFGFQAALDFLAEPGTSYLVQVGALGGLEAQQGTLRLEISEGSVGFESDPFDPFQQVDPFDPFQQVDGRSTVPAIVIGFLALWLALAMWVYFDAIQLGRPAIAWAGSVLFLGWLLLVPLFLYLIFRDRPGRPVAPGSGRRLYLYIASFSALAVTVTGLFILIAGVLEGAVSDFGDQFREALATSIAVLAVGGPVWLYHWRTANRTVSRSDDEDEFQATFVMHRSYLHVVVGFYAIIAGLLALLTIGAALGTALDVGDLDVENWIGAAGGLVVVLVVIAAHYWGELRTSSYRSLKDRYEGPTTEGEASK